MPGPKLPFPVFKAASMPASLPVATAGAAPAASKPAMSSTMFNAARSNSLTAANTNGPAGSKSLAPPGSQPRPAAQTATANGNHQQQGQAQQQGQRQQGQQQQQKKPECLPTQFRGVVYRTTDKQFLSLVQVPMPAGPMSKEQQPVQQVDLQWLLLGEFPAVLDAITMRDAVSISLFGINGETVKPPSSYTLDSVITWLLRARDFGGNDQFLSKTLLSRAIDNAVAAKVQADNYIRINANNILHKYLLQCGAPAGVPITSAAGTAAAAVPRPSPTSSGAAAAGCRPVPPNSTQPAGSKPARQGSLQSPASGTSTLTATAARTPAAMVAKSPTAPGSQGPSSSCGAAQQPDKLAAPVAQSRPPAPASTRRLAIGAPAQQVSAHGPKPTGVTKGTSGPNQDKWNAKHRFYGPTGGFCMVGLGWYKTREEAERVHDCAALNVAGSVLLHPPSIYTLAQASSIVRSVIKDPRYNQVASQITQQARYQAIISGARPDKDKAVPGYVHVSLLVGVASDLPEHVTVALLVVGGPPRPVAPPPEAPVSAASATTTSSGGAPLAATGSTGPAAAQRSSKAIIKYKPLAKQSLAQAWALLPEGQQAAEPPPGFAEAVLQAATLHGVHATMDPATQAIKFLAKVTINHSAWVVSEHATAAEAARAHDAAAVGLFGREALPHLNTSPATQLTWQEVARTLQGMAERLSWLRLRFLPHMQECAAECGLAVHCGTPAGTAPSQGRSPTPPTRKRPVRSPPPDKGQEQEEGPAAPPAKVPRLSHADMASALAVPVEWPEPDTLVPGMPVPLPTEQQLQHRSNAHSRAVTNGHAKPTTYFGVYKEVQGPMKGTFSAKQGAPTSSPNTQSIYLVLGYYATEVEAARARDMAAIATQSAPRLNFPANQYTRAMVMSMASTIVHHHGRLLAPDVRQIIERNVVRWEAKVKGIKRKGAAATGLHALAAPCATSTGSLTAAAAPGLPPGHVQVHLLVEPTGRVRLQLVAARGSGSSQQQLKQRGAVAGVPGSARASLNQRLVSKAEQHGQGSQRRSHRKQAHPQSGGIYLMDSMDLGTPHGLSGHVGRRDQASAAEEEEEGEESGSQEDVEMQAAADHEGEHSGDDAWCEAQERALLDSQRATKRARGIATSTLSPDEDYMGVHRDPASTPAKPVWIAKAKISLPNRDVRPQYLVIGRSEDEELAARLRDLAVLGLSSAASPKLNFDADEYSLSEVELLLRTLCEDSPRMYSMDVLPHVLANATRHGVRDDLGGMGATQAEGHAPALTHEGAAPEQATLRALAQHGKAVRVAESAAGPGTTAQPAQQGWPGPLVQSSAMEEDDPGVREEDVVMSTSREVAGNAPTNMEVDEEGTTGGALAQDYVQARFQVVPVVRLHLLVDQCPSPHRPAVRAVVQVTQGVKLQLRATKGPAHPAASDLDALMVLAHAAATTDPLAAGSSPLAPSVKRTRIQWEAAAGQVDDKGALQRPAQRSRMSTSDTAAAATVGVGVPSLVATLAELWGEPHHKQVQVLEQALVRLRGASSDAAFAEALQRLLARQPLAMVASAAAKQQPAAPAAGQVLVAGGRPQALGSGVLQQVRTQQQQQQQAVTPTVGGVAPARPSRVVIANAHSSARRNANTASAAAAVAAPAEPYVHPHHRDVMESGNLQRTASGTGDGPSSQAQQQQQALGAQHQHVPSLSRPQQLLQVPDRDGVLVHKSGRQPRPRTTAAGGSLPGSGPASSRARPQPSPILLQPYQQVATPYTPVVELPEDGDEDASVVVAAEQVRLQQQQQQRKQLEVRQQERQAVLQAARSRSSTAGPPQVVQVAEGGQQVQIMTAQQAQQLGYRVVATVQPREMARLVSAQGVGGPGQPQPLTAMMVRAPGQGDQQQVRAVLHASAGAQHVLASVGAGLRS